MASPHNFQSTQNWNNRHHTMKGFFNPSPNSSIMDRSNSINKSNYDQDYSFNTNANINNTSRSKHTAYSTRTGTGITPKCYQRGLTLSKDYKIGSRKMRTTRTNKSRGKRRKERDSVFGDSRYENSSRNRHRNNVSLDLSSRTGKRIKLKNLKLKRHLNINT